MKREGGGESFADACVRFAASKWDAGRILAQAAHAQACATLGGNDENPLPVVRWAAEAGPEVRGDARAILAEWELTETLPGLPGPLTEGVAEAHRASCQLARAWIGED